MKPINNSQGTIIIITIAVILLMGIVAQLRRTRRRVT